MSKQLDEGEQMFVLATALADTLARAPDAELLETAREAGRDLEATRRAVQETLRSAVRSFKRKRLEAAQAEHLDSVRGIRAGRAKLPTRASEQRALLSNLLKRPGMAQVTLQFRNFDEMTETDVASLLEQLAHLGLVDDENDD